MGWINNMSEKVKKTINIWLNRQSVTGAISITEVLDFELNAIQNRIWYRGDGNELEQLYQQRSEFADKHKFWASKSSLNMEMRKIHTGLPGLIVKVLTDIALTDMNGFEFSSGAQQNVWADIEEQNHFRRKLKRAVREVLYIGDGAWKISLDTKKKPLPVVNWYPGDRIELIYDGDELTEIIFKTLYQHRNRNYVLHERYGYGYIINELYRGENLVDLTSIPQTSGLQDITFDSSVMLAVPFLIYDSAKFEGRGGSIFDGKIDNFDAFDEVWSQWIDALRAGRAKTYIPDKLIPHNARTGKLEKPNAFDNRYIVVESDMREKEGHKIVTEQPAIPHESYLASYSTALDMCLQGVISPSTLGIDVKKLDNSEAQREKEKTTLYTRNAIVDALQEVLPQLAAACIHCLNILNQQSLEIIEANVQFGEYANPSFESQVETVAKARTGGIMSIERSVEELYGDTLDEHCKEEEVSRLKAEQGIAEVEEPSVSMSAGEFSVDAEGEKDDGSGAESQNVSNESE